MPQQGVWEGGPDPAFLPASWTSVISILNIVYFPHSASYAQILANPTSRVAIKTR